MLLYSFLGLLTLQIGVAVLSAMYFILAVLASISNFLNVNSKSGSIPINYILLGVFVTLTLIAGLVMFFAAYNESKGYCIVSVILMVILLLLFVATSIVSFLNMPKMTRNVCIPQGHCPESVWLSSLNYRNNPIDPDEEDYYEGTTTPGTTVNTSATEPGNGPERFFQARQREWGRRKYQNNYNMYPPTICAPLEAVVGLEQRPEQTSEEITRMSSPEAIVTESTEVKPEAIVTESTEVKPEAIVTESTDVKESTELKVNFEFNFAPENNKSFRDEKNNEGILSIVKRSIFSILSKVMKHKYTRETDDEPADGDVESADVTGDAGGADKDEDDEDAGDETTTGSGDEEEGKDKKPKYKMGPHFFMAIILFLLIALFFVFTIVVLLSYRKQLIYIELYAVNPSSKHYIVD